MLGWTWSSLLLLLYLMQMQPLSICGQIGFCANVKWIHSGTNFCHWITDYYSGSKQIQVTYITVYRFGPNATGLQTVQLLFCNFQSIIDIKTLEIVIKKNTITYKILLIYTYCQWIYHTGHWRICTSGFWHKHEWKKSKLYQFDYF